jgi:hypothetical protein
MKAPSIKQTKSDSVTFTLPVIDDATAVMVYNFLCELVDHFDTHYGAQICHFYTQQQHADTRSPQTNQHNDSSH